MKNIVILATGGTIAGEGEIGENLGYVSGAISAKKIVDSIPEIKDIANVTVEQICNINSDDITDKIWLQLAKRLNELQNDFKTDGIVITHGTDTMEETAYFLSLTVKRECEKKNNRAKPIILTGSMRPFTAKNPDGKENLLGAIRSAVGFSIDEDSPENFVWVYFGGELFDARRVQKCSASELKPMGVNFPMEGSDWNSPLEKNFFDVSDLDELPKVNVIYFSVDFNPKILEYAASVSDGLVIAGAGSGEFSLLVSKTLSKIDIPIVISSRINHGMVYMNKTLAKAPDGIARVCSNDLPPSKAAVLLRLALTVTQNKKKLQKIFDY